MVDQQELPQEDVIPDGKVGEAGALYAFMGWLTSRDPVSGPFSARHKAGQAAELVGQFCKMQGWELDDPVNWHRHIKPYREDAPQNATEATRNTGEQPAVTPIDPVPIIVNGRKKVVTTDELSYDQVLDLAFNTVPITPDYRPTVIFHYGSEENPGRSLLRGATVRVKEGMIFSVAVTGKA